LWQTFSTNRLPLMLFDTLPHPWMIALLPIGWMRVTNLRRFAFFAIFPLLFGLYTFNVLMLPHYVIVWAPIVVFNVLLAVEALAKTWPNAGRGIVATMSLLIVASAVGASPWVDRDVNERWQTPVMDDVRQKLATLAHTPALVLFHYEPRENAMHDEPVYNVETAAIDDANIIRAHELGPETEKLIRYYAERQPKRYVYLYDRGSMTLRELGPAGELAGGGR
jgi:hypothetical protein